jgi:hypothetical protein
MANTLVINEVQVLAVQASAGTYTLLIGGQTTAPIAHDANAQAIETALNSLSTLTPGSVRVDGSGPFTIQFTGVRVAHQPQPLIVVDTSGLAGTASISRTQSGKAISSQDRRSIRFTGEAHIRSAKRWTGGQFSTRLKNTTKLTISYMARMSDLTPRGAGGGVQRILTLGNLTAPPYPYWIVQYDQFGIQTTFTYRLNGIPYSFGDWPYDWDQGSIHHFMTVYDGPGSDDSNWLRFYRDGILVKTVAAPSNQAGVKYLMMAEGTDYVEFGKVWGENNANAKFDIADFVVWHDYLGTAQDAADLAQGTKRAFEIAPDKIVAAYGFDGGTLGSAIQITDESIKNQGVIDYDIESLNLIGSGAATYQGELVYRPPVVIDDACVMPSREAVFMRFVNRETNEPAAIPSSSTQDDFRQPGKELMLEINRGGLVSQHTLVDVFFHAWQNTNWLYFLFPEGVPPLGENDTARIYAPAAWAVTAIGACDAVDQVLTVRTAVPDFEAVPKTMKVGYNVQDYYNCGVPMYANIRKFNSPWKFNPTGYNDKREPIVNPGDTYENTPTWPSPVRDNDPYRTREYGSMTNVNPYYDNPAYGTSGFRLGRGIRSMPPKGKVAIEWSGTDTCDLTPDPSSSEYVSWTPPSSTVTLPNGRKRRTYSYEAYNPVANPAHPHGKPYSPELHFKTTATNSDYALYINADNGTDLAQWNFDVDNPPLWHPHFLEVLSKAKALRFLDPTATNDGRNNRLRDWANPKVDTYGQVAFNQPEELLYTPVAKISPLNAEQKAAFFKSYMRNQHGGGVGWILETTRPHNLVDGDNIEYDPWPSAPQYRVYATTGHPIHLNYGAGQPLNVLSPTQLIMFTSLDSRTENQRTVGTSDITLSCDRNSVNGGTAYADGAMYEEYTIVVTQASTGGNYTTARLNITSLSNKDNATNVQPAASGASFSFGHRGCTITFTGTADLQVGDTWLLKVWAYQDLNTDETQYDVDRVYLESELGGLRIYHPRTNLMPLTHMVNLCNTVGADLWLPHSHAKTQAVPDDQGDNIPLFVKISSPINASSSSIVLVKVDATSIQGKLKPGDILIADKPSTGTPVDRSDGWEWIKINSISNDTPSATTVSVTRGVLGSVAQAYSANQQFMVLAERAKSWDSRELRHAFRIIARELDTNRRLIVEHTNEPWNPGVPFYMHQMYLGQRGQNLPGRGAVLKVTELDANGGIKTVVVDQPGTGYFAGRVYFYGPGTGARGYIKANPTTGAVESVWIKSAGSGYGTPNASNPSGIPGIEASIGIGRGASITITGISGGAITGVSIANGGLNYIPGRLRFVGGSGQGAWGTFGVDGNGTINSVSLGSGGTGYQVGDTVHVEIPHSLDPGTLYVYQGDELIWQYMYVALAIRTARIAREEFVAAGRPATDVKLFLNVGFGFLWDRLADAIDSFNSQASDMTRIDMLGPATYNDTFESQDKVPATTINRMSFQQHLDMLELSALYGSNAVKLWNDLVVSRGIQVASYEGGWNFPLHKLLEGIPKGDNSEANLVASAERTLMWHYLCRHPRIVAPVLYHMQRLQDDGCVLFCRFTAQNSDYFPSGSYEQVKDYALWRDYLSYGEVAGKGDGTDGKWNNLQSAPNGLKAPFAEGYSVSPQGYAFQTWADLAEPTSNQPPVLTVPASVSGLVGEVITFTATATDPDVGQTLTFSLVSPPSGATIDSQTGVFTWTPSSSGSYAITVRVTDNGDPALSTSRVVTVTVASTNQPPTLTVPALLTGTVGQSLTFTATASDPDVGQTLTFSLVNPPSGASIHSQTGVFTWTPSSAGTYSITVRVADNGDPPYSDTRTVSLSVSTTNKAPVLTVPASLSGTTNQALTFTATATDPDPTQTLTFALVDPPSGASINAPTGLFTWTPMEAGSYTITVRVTDNGDPVISDTRSISATIAQPNQPPTLLVPDLISGVPNQPLTFTATVTDPDQDQTHTFSLDPVVPSGAMINAVTGIFSWTPDTSGSFTVTVRVTDDGTPPLSDAKSVTINVSAVNRPPVLSSPTSPLIGTTGIPLIFTVSAIDPDPSQVLTFSLDPGAPSGASIDASTGTFTWTPSAAGSYTATIRVRDNGNPPLSDASSVVIVVAEANRPPTLNLLLCQLQAVIGQPVTFTATAADPNPGQSFVFSLDPGAPTGAVIDPTTGVFSWTPSEAGRHVITIRVTDNGTPYLSATSTITIDVFQKAFVPNPKKLSLRSRQPRIPLR